MTFTTINPATGETIRSYPGDSDDDIEHKLTAAKAAWTQWRAMTVPERATVLAPLATALRSSREQLASLVTMEMGKPVEQSLAEVERA